MTALHPRTRSPFRALYAALYFACACSSAEHATRPEAPPALKPKPPATSPERAGRVITHAGSEWVVFDLDLSRTNLALLGQAPDAPHTFEALRTLLAERGERLVMATNAGIFDTHLRPLGLHIERGEELHPFSTARGDGNFFLKPNGVFWIDERGAHVAATDRYEPQGVVSLATQSGPLLLEQGKPHPAFASPGTSLKIRSAVGVDRRGHVFLVLSRVPVSFIDSATLFRDALACDDALYLDGEISAVLTPDGVEGTAQAYAGLIVATERISQ